MIQESPFNGVVRQLIRESAEPVQDSDGNLIGPLHDMTRRQTIIMARKSARKGMVDTTTTLLSLVNMSEIGAGTIMRKAFQAALSRKRMLLSAYLRKGVVLGPRHVECAESYFRHADVLGKIDTVLESLCDHVVD